MHRKLSGYFLLSLFSFFFFSVVFQTIANAQESTGKQSFQNPEITNQTQSLPTPTIYNTPPSTQTLHAQQFTQLSPTPTIYLAQQPSLATPIHTSTIENKQEITPTPTEIPPTATPTAMPQPTITRMSDLETLFTKYSTVYNSSENELKKIANCESGFNNTSDTGTYAGMFQFAVGTWISMRNMMGMDTNTDLRKNPEEAIKTAAFMLAQGKQNAWPNCH
ncbi:MAG TPA: transglycosylase SLT domain-containing protein [Candidatus Sulfotelmatobacter sp.]|jgi:hypothetical protein|nr:transglycosylase SLT domain-containing protein [Candidatus Sulfotelmatobacter sp.]